MSDPTSPADEASADRSADSDPDTGEAAGARREVARALGEIRREAYKVAAIYAVVDAALATLVVNLALRVAGPSWAEGTVRAASVPVPTPIVVGVAAGAVVLVVEFGLRARRPVVAQFEAANPAVREMLRTARDAVDDDRDSRMARALYDDVLARLRETSSVGLVDARRLTATLLVVAVVSVASIQVVVVDLQLGGTDGPTAPGAAETPDYDGLRSGDEVLGEAENVSAGDNELDAQLGGSGEGEAPPGGAPSSYDAGGLPSGDVESQRAGFSDAERVEDAELIRDYTLELSNQTDE